MTKPCCGTCRFWSEMLAFGNAEGVFAWCLNEANAGPFAGDTAGCLPNERYTHTDHHCPHYQYGQFAIDDPRQHEKDWA